MSTEHTLVDIAFGLSQPEPERTIEGLRLIKAFIRISDPTVRTALIEFAERIASTAATTQ